jgi:hypothetical protein
VGHPEHVTAREQSPVREGWLPRSSFGRWWLRFRLFDAIYVAMCACGALMLVVAALDSAVSWPSDRVLIAPATLENRLALPLIFPGWLVMMLTFVALGGQRRRKGRPAAWSWKVPRLGLPWALGVTVLIVAVLGFILVSLILGADKGSVRQLSGPRYQVSFTAGNEGPWTTVSAGDYRRWEARIVREDAIFTAFGLAELGAAVAILRLRRAARLQLT